METKIKDIINPEMVTINPDDMKKILGEDYAGRGVVFWSDQAIVDGIDKVFTDDVGRN